MKYNLSHKQITGIIAAGILGLGVLGIAPHCSRDNYQIKVTGSERVIDEDVENKSKGNREITSKYVVFTQDVNSGAEIPFENTDSMLECVIGGCKFDSSTLQAKLKAAEKSGATCDIKTYGWRVPFLSMYENIIGVDCKTP